MPVILLEKDPFVEAEATLATTAFDNAFNVRRPFYGVQSKSPRPAYLSIYQEAATGTGLTPVSLIDSSAPGGFSEANHNFILQGVSETRQEKAQIVETFGDHFVFFYGSKPIVLAIRGFLINTTDFNWKNEFLRNYENRLRGTRCVENRTRVFLGWDDVLAQGYILGTAIEYSSDLPSLIPFQFQLLCSKVPLLLDDGNEEDIVGQGEDARVLVNNDGTITDTRVEYIGALKDYGQRDIDPLSGESTFIDEATTNVPGSLDNDRSASWVSGTDPRKQQWKSQDSALMDLNTILVAQEAGSDNVTSRLALARNPGSFPLASRSTAVATIAGSLVDGISNSAAVVSDAPALE